MNKPVAIDFSQVKEFKTKNHTYIVSLDTMAIDRFGTFQQKEIACLNYLSISNPISFQDELVKALNKMDIVNLGRLLSDKQYLYSLKKSTPDFILEFCATFIYREDEDYSDSTEKLTAEKIKDWKANNIDIMSFFTLSMMASQTLLTGYKAFTNHILSKADKKEN